MKKIIGKAGIGKTKQLITDAALNNGTIVCRDVEEMYEKMHAYGIVGVNVISYSDFITADKTTSKFFVDDVSKFLGHFNVAEFVVTED